MKNAVRIIVSMMIVVIISGCGLSPEAIGETVRESMQEKFNTDSDFKEHDLMVDSVQLSKKGDNSYKGLVAVIYKQSAYDVTVEILVDGENVLWEAAPGSFHFIAQKQLQNLTQ